LIQTVPPAGDSLRSTTAGDVESEPAAIFGIGVSDLTLTPENVRLLAPDGSTVPVAIHPNRWGGNGYSRIVKIEPLVDLLPNHDYTVEIGPGIATIDGRMLTQTLSFAVSTGCGSPDCARTTQQQLDAPYCNVPIGTSGLTENAGCRVSMAKGVTYTLLLQFVLLWGLVVAAGIWMERRKTELAPIIARRC